MSARPDDVDLHYHADQDVTPDLVDLAVNVRQSARPPWLHDALAHSLTGLDRYPDATAARRAVAARHRRPTDEVLLTAGAAEAFVLLARRLAPARCVVVHPQFTEPEAAMRAAGHRVERLILQPPFTLDPRQIPDDADVVMIGNPTNPTSVSHPARILASLARPGRILVVDEAFADCVAGEPESLASRDDLPGVVVIRSLTKTWALAGLRCGYLLAPPELVTQLAAGQPLWPVSGPALAAINACCQPNAVAEATAWALDLVEERDYLSCELAAIGIDVVSNPAASFVLVQHERAQELRLKLRTLGFALRRGDTFPGLGPAWLRIAVRDRARTDAFVKAVGSILG